MSTDGVSCPRCCSDRIFKKPIFTRNRGRAANNFTKQKSTNETLEKQYWCANCGKEFNEEEKRVV